MAQTIKSINFNKFNICSQRPLTLAFSSLLKLYNLFSSLSFLYDDFSEKIDDFSENWFYFDKWEIWNFRSFWLPNPLPDHISTSSFSQVKKMALFYYNYLLPGSYLFLDEKHFSYNHPLPLRAIRINLFYECFHWANAKYLHHIYLPGGHIPLVATAPLLCQGKNMDLGSSKLSVESFIHDTHIKD